MTSEHEILPLNKEAVYILCSGTVLLPLNYLLNNPC